MQDAAEATAAQLQEEHYRLVAQLQRLNGQAGSSSSSSLGAAAAVAGAASEPAAVDWDEVRQAAAAWAQLDAQAKRHAAELQPLLQQVAGSSVHPSPIDGSRLGPQKDVAVLVEGWLQQVQQVAAAASELAAAAGTSDSGGGQAAAAAAVFVGGGGDLTARSAVAALPAAQLLTGCGPHASHAQRLLAVHRSGASAVESAYAAVQQSVAEAQHEVQQLTQRLAAAGIMGPMAATSAAAGVGPFFASPAPTSALRQQPNGAASSSVLSPAPAPAAFSAPKFLSAAAAAGWSVAAGAPGGAQAAPLLSPELLQQKQLLQMRMRQLQLIGDDGDGGTAATASAVAAPQAGLEPASAASLVAEAPASPLAAKSPVLSAAKPKRLTYAGEARQQQAAAAAAGSAARRAPPTTGRRPLATAASSNGANGRQRSAPPGSPTLRITLRNLYTDLGGGRSAVAKAEDKENSPDEAAQPDGALPLTTKPPSVDSPAAAATSKLSASFSDLPHLPRVASPAATAPKPLQTGTSNRPAAPASALLASSGAGAAQLQALRSRFAALASRVAGN